MYPPLPRIRAPQISICAFAAGVFTGGGGLKNQLKKVAIGVDATCLASDNSGLETNAQGAVAIRSKPSTQLAGASKSSSRRRAPTPTTGNCLDGSIPSREYFFHTRVPEAFA
jgi:hypothetical protein